MIKKIKKFLFLFTFISSSFNCNAQLFPVQLTPVFKNPYSVKISDYATSMDTKMQLMINPTDVTISYRQVRLKLYIQGNGINIQSSDYITGQKPIFINGGEFQTLTNIDISALFRLENLQGITAAQYANPLPDGMYNFCFEMYDYITNQKISQKSCASLYLILNDPPLLNTPQKNEQIASSDFPNIMFTWTPRQMNAINVSYKFELKQLLDPSLDPQFAFQMSPILYEETLFGTALLYNLNMPILTPGMRYAWRVRAISTTGLSENAIFKNDGYSEIYSFKYTQKCNPPTFALSEIVSPSTVKITWQGIPDHTKYQVQYRKKAIAVTNKRGKTTEKTFEWFSTYSLNNQVLLTNLEPETIYEFRVGSSCTTEAEGVQSFTYSNTNTFTIPKKENAIASYNCGIKPNFNISNQKPLTNLIQSETFTAGDFPVTILELKGENSPYSGRGYIVVPYLADTKIAVEFNNIIVNTDYQLISGVVETSYNADWGNVINGKDIYSDAKNVVDKVLTLLDKDEVLEKQKSEGTINDTEYVEEKKEIWDELNEANTQYKELAKTTDLPEDLQKRRDDLDPIFVDSASNSGAISGNQNDENKKKIREVYNDAAEFHRNNCQDLNDGKVTLQDLDDYKIYSTPTGKALALKGATNLDLESIYPNESYPDLKVPKGALVAFTKGSYSFKAKYKKEANKWKFIGYFNGEIEYLDTDTAEFKSKYGAGDNSHEGFALVLGTGASTELSKSVLVSLGETAGLSAEGAVIFRSITGTAMLAYIIIETFVVTSTVTSVSGDVLDLPATTPIVPITDSYLKDIPVDLPITIPHSIPKEDTGGTCKVYVIWKVATNGKISVAKYGMTCTEDYDENCNMRPEKQCAKFEKENNAEKNKFFYNWVIKGVSKEMTHIIEKSLTANYVIANMGKMPSHHYLPCFIKKDDFEERVDRAVKWLEDKIKEFGK
ncbi:fibronectin type III domain-containing protein [Flavobacterium soyae]|uniref:fibronectin type III domain-containing protein n=1 Tax=Flavobacterium soyae TaxID=2903098 RepID=UPI001E3BA516|nr:fibronectin type III domain-containing protein [Flavobacterium soyae]MCD9576529.1 fibronectin type III domain-containing protein [Flavobacterium soyae]